MDRPLRRPQPHVLVLLLIVAALTSDVAAAPKRPDRSDRPATPAVDPEQHRQDLLSAHAYWCAYRRPPDPDAVWGRLTVWLRTNPGDAATRFYVALLDLDRQIRRGDWNDATVDATRGEIEKAAAEGSAGAKAWLGLNYVSGVHCPRDEKRGYALLRDAMEHNEAHAFQSMGVLLLARKPPQAEKALVYLERARELGPGGRSLLACAYALLGKRELAVKEVRASAAERDTSGMSLLADWLQAGELVPKDAAGAFRLRKEAAELGDTLARWRLGRMYEAGVGTDPDLSAAYQCYASAAQSSCGSAQVDRARMLLNGIGVDPNPPRAVAILEHAARPNRRSHGGLADAQLMLGKLYLEGQWVKRDERRARQLLEAAAAAGNPEAKDSLKSMPPSTDVLRSIDGW
jgi:TPR repeat protein